MTPTEIRIELLRRGITMSDIARQLGCSRQNVQHTIRGRQRSLRVRQAVAAAIGKQTQDVWSDIDQAA
jgi:DNA-binding NarL/FixJ family response regulator